MWVQSMKEITATAKWLKAWDLVGQQANPQTFGRIPKRLAYLQYYALDVAYLSPPGPDEPLRHFMRRMYNTLQQMAVAGRGTQRMRVVQKRPTTDCDRVWRNLHAYGVSEVIKSAWYSVIHESSQQTNA
jgi:hypothetical protein